MKRIKRFGNFGGLGLNIITISATTILGVLVYTV
jgi:hypothetical protein